jgi:hypothetical protein
MSRLKLMHLPERHETTQQGIEVRFELRNALFPLAEWGQIKGYLREAEGMARTLDDQRRLGWVSAYVQPSATNGRPCDRCADVCAEGGGCR